MGSRFYNLLLKRKVYYKLGAGFVVHWIKVSTFKGVYYNNVRSFYIGLRVAGVILFSGISGPKCV